HITAAERTLWNTVSNKVDKVTGKGLSTEDYTTAEKSKLSSIETNANRYVHPNDANTRHVTDAEKTTWNGKANATHKHKKADITDFPTSLPANGGTADNATYINPVSLTNQDLNSIDRFGTYYAGGSNTVTNKPSGVDAFGMQVLKSASGWITQVLYASNNQERIYIRYGGTERWGAWIELFTTNRKPSKSDVGLSNVDNTSDANKPISTATQNALNLKADKTHVSDMAAHITASERTAWNNKANASHGNHVPATQSANNKKFLRCDNTWQDVTPGNIGAAPASHTHDDRYYTESEANAKFVSKEDLGAAGYGDMTKAIYDTNNSGIVDKAESVAWDGITGKPPTFLPSAHTHTKSQISDFPTSLPANGGNADTVDGLHASSFTRVHSGSVNFGGNNKEITTAEFKTLLTTMGAFKQPHWIARGSWSYATNQIITDSGFGKIHLAGCVVEVIGTSSAYTIRISTPTTASGGSSSTLNCEFMYVDNGTSYSPRWSKIWTSNNDGGGSGMDADTVDGKHASDFLPKKGLTWNDLKGV
ncbi:MAG: pyocin knob domain-containing protein, partial [Clostridiales bacterium]|nr:pyocin knob domain-containing protein [Clostridiales bacterium]